MTVLVNGSPRTTAQGTVAGLLGELTPAPQMLLVEHNGEAVLRTQWEATPIQEGDHIEILRVAAGG
jgi:sulfur carrier protein